MRKIKVGNRYIGSGEPVYIIAEIGINHNGSMDNVRKLMYGAKAAGCDAVKFQKRTPEICVPKDQWNVERDTPWGRMSYIEYRHKIELGENDYAEIDNLSRKIGIDWFASCWDEESVDFIEKYNPKLYKASSASLTDLNLLKKKKSTGKPLVISTGMSTINEIEKAVINIGEDNLLIAHSTSTYPCPLEELNLRMISTLSKMFPNNPIGYSGHETGLAPTWAAVALGSSFVERHITIDRAMWGSDQAASVEIEGFHRLVKNIRDIEQALGDGIKRIYKSEIGPRKKLRKIL
ncbi:N-acetylneuraminate synthase [Ignavibacteria bacterium CHB1]|nr:MAG: N-acetylneuraminate synthase [Chlorobiota bacterium]MCC6885454.1 N-acetylneuraminate synthase family protein [Ignavibacteriales bacterium]MCE7952805.1 N-acetylneuraminate synthase [Chlorobi bacterium CHB7]MDL1887027.1 N-acetylneuraminate synthase [Ignavibacteria bacterium CHB1]RIK49567.1 MAG: N-acetylneuraminate synthase [Ignavibacteriota bacterium]